VLEPKQAQSAAF